MNNPYKSYGFIDQAEMERKAPSIFTKHAYDKMSDKYHMIPTIDMVDVLRDQGFGVTQVMQSRSRIVGKKGHEKHIVRMRHLDAKSIGNDETYPELLITNDSAGGTRFKMMSGLFRLVCSNGLIVSDSTFGEFNIKHIGDIEADVINGSQSIVESIPLIANKIEMLQSIELTKSQENVFCESAAAMRWGRDDKGNIKSPLRNIQDLNTVRRHSDGGCSLWDSYNRVQENLMKGGLRGVSASGRRTSTRAVAAVDASNKINQELMVLAMKMAELAG
jgi:hypothetical protein